MKFKGLPLLFLSMIVLLNARASDLRMRAMGGLQIVLPDADNQLNLYRYAGNMAWLQANDSTNWMKFRFANTTAWGTLHRLWDAEQPSLTELTFIGQKHISENQVFYGSVQYDMNVLKKVNYAIDPQPYDLDPFVLADSTTGNFTYSGPHVFVAFNHHLWEKLWWGVSLDYQISRGLKNVYTRPEIIRRAIHFSMDLAYMVTPAWTAGLSFRPYDDRDLTKLVRQPDGQSPRVLRYRGEYIFSAVLGTDDRTAKYNGYEVAPQLAFASPRLKGVISAAYYYRWLELFDGTAVQNFDGYYQGKHYSFDTAWRYYPFNKSAAALAFNYNFVYIFNWAREPIAGFEIYRAFYRQHRIIAGVSYPWKNLPLTTAGEIQFKYLLPDRRNHLAHVIRRGAISDTRLRLGLEWRSAPHKFLQAGCIFQQYTENSVWRYFGNYRGAALTFGTAYRSTAMEVELFGYYGHLAGQTYGKRSRNQLDFLLQIKRKIN